MVLGIVASGMVLNVFAPERGPELLEVHILWGPYGLGLRVMDPSLLEVYGRIPPERHEGDGDNVGAVGSSCAAKSFKQRPLSKLCRVPRARKPLNPKHRNLKPTTPKKC